MGLDIVLVFFAAQFVAYFKWTNFGTIIAIKGATLLQALSRTGPEVFIGFILLCALINLSLGSSSAQWAAIQYRLFSWLDHTILRLGVWFWITCRASITDLFSAVIKANIKKPHNCGLTCIHPTFLIPAKYDL